TEDYLTGKPAMAAVFEAGTDGEEDAASFDFSDDLTDYDAEHNIPKVLSFNIAQVSKPLKLTRRFSINSLLKVQKEIRTYMGQNIRLMDQLKHRQYEVRWLDAPEAMKQLMLKSLSSVYNKLDKINHQLRERQKEVEAKEREQCTENWWMDGDESDCSDWSED
ncbi:MAG: hypothetical protein Q9174_007192, partial [Haloplaca sp. 1 TL-2023]